MEIYTCWLDANCRDGFPTAKTFAPCFMQLVYKNSTVFRSQVRTTDWISHTHTSNVILILQVYHVNVFTDYILCTEFSFLVRHFFLSDFYFFQINVQKHLFDIFVHSMSCLANKKILEDQMYFSQKKLKNRICQQSDWLKHKRLSAQCSYFMVPNKMKVAVSSLGIFHCVLRRLWLFITIIYVIL